MTNYIQMHMYITTSFDHKVKYLGDLALGIILEVFIFACFSHDSSLGTVYKCTMECTSIGLK